MEPLMTTLKRPARKPDRKVDGFSGDSTQETHFSCVRCPNQCSQLWSPLEGPKLEKIEKVLKDFTKRIPELQSMNYWKRPRAEKDGEVEDNIYLQNYE